MVSERRERKINRRHGEAGVRRRHEQLVKGLFNGDGHEWDGCRSSHTHTHTHTHTDTHTHRHTHRQGVYVHNRDLFMDFYSGRNAPFSNSSII